MLELAMAGGFAVAGGVAAFLVPGRPSRFIMLLYGLMAAFSVSASAVILQRLVLDHFFDVDVVPAVDGSADLLFLAAAGAAAFFAGFVGGQWVERYAAPWRAARRRAPPGVDRPPPPAPPLGPAP